MDSKIKILFALQRVRQGSTVVMLCMFLAFWGCNSDESTLKVDEDTFSEILETSSSSISEWSKDGFPEWLKEIITRYENGGERKIPTPSKFFQGKWNGRVVYFIENPLSSCMICDVFYEYGERIVWEHDGIEGKKFCSESKDWKLIYIVCPDAFNSPSSQIPFPLPFTWN